MAAIYSDQYKTLKALLDIPGMGEDATLLIPDLQRPYVWQPKQAIALVDSLIRGWPFGTLMTWKAKESDPVRTLARSFSRVVDRVDKKEEGEQIDTKHPPAEFQMVLDGQQRIQSLLLALGGDSWGFKLLDREWYEHLRDAKPRGPRGKKDWSLGCLCVDVPVLHEEYAKHKRATSIDYTKVLQWVVTDDAKGQSNLPKPENYHEPLSLASKEPGRFIRLARLWREAPDQVSIDYQEVQNLAGEILSGHGVARNECEKLKPGLGALIVALHEVKKSACFILNWPNMKRPSVS